MKKIIAFFKSLFSIEEEKPAQTYAEVKKEAEVHAEQIVKALDEVKKTRVKPAEEPVAPIAATEVAKAPAKKKRKYYKPKQPKA